MRWVDLLCPPAQTISSTCSKKKVTFYSLCHLLPELTAGFLCPLKWGWTFFCAHWVPLLGYPKPRRQCVWVPWFSQPLVGEGLQIPSIDPCMEPAGCITSSKVAALGCQQCSCCLTHEHCLPQGFQQLPTATVSLIAEISDLNKDLHVSADVVTSANYGLSSVEGGVYAYILILVCIVVWRCKIPRKCWLLIVTIITVIFIFHHFEYQLFMRNQCNKWEFFQSFLVHIVFSHIKPDVLEESDLTQTQTSHCKTVYNKTQDDTLQLVTPADIDVICKTVPSLWECEGQEGAHAAENSSSTNSLGSKLWPRCVFCACHLI